MPDIDPAALTRTESFAQPLAPSSLTLKQNGASALALQKATKAANAIPRIDIEPLYAELKGAIAEHWGEYKAAISLFVLGALNQDELCLRTDHFLNANSYLEHLHNQLLAGILANVARDLPDVGVAPWVSANDKPTVLSKGMSGDAAEQRLKTEVMQLPSRDRRRLKEIAEPDQFDQIPSSLSQYHQAKQFRSAEYIPSSAGGFNRINWDLEIRKRYAQPLASETGEFPDADTINGRMVPICYEEGLPSGCSTLCSNFMATATEHFIKEVLSAVYTRTRTNMPSGSVNSVLTHRFKKQLAREEDAAVKGAITRMVGSGLLPIEAKEVANRKVLGMNDLQLALDVADCGLGQFPLVAARVRDGYQDGEYESYISMKREFEEEAKAEEDREGERVERVRKSMPDVKMTNGVNGTNSIHGIKSYEEEDEEEDWGWEGGAAADRMQLNALLDECLAIGQ